MGTFPGEQRRTSTHASVQTVAHRRPSSASQGQGRPDRPCICHKPVAGCVPLPHHRCCRVAVGDVYEGRAELDVLGLHTQAVKGIDQRCVTYIHTGHCWC